MDHQQAREHTSVVIRPYEHSDAAESLALFISAVTETASADYTAEQVQAWAQPECREVGAWHAAMLARNSIVATIEGELAGFSDVSPDGYVDMMFVSPRHQRRGVARRLLAHVEVLARSEGTPALSADVSITALPFFERHGFTVEAEQQPVKAGVELTNYKMRKELRRETSLRDAKFTDLARLQEIERQAGEVFRVLGMNVVADDEPLGLELLRGYVERGQAWVIADHGDVPVAYLLADVVDGAGHVEQVSVIPGHARQGLGRVLLDHACEWALGNGLKAVTLTTFANIPWNAPYYERCGFRRLSTDDLTPGLLRIRGAEAEHGLDAWPRVCMRRLLAGPNTLDEP